MPSILVTGAGGFVGRHLLREVGEAAVPAEFDVTDREAVVEEVHQTQPDAIVHLAAHSSVGGSWGADAEVWAVNALGTVNLLEAVRREVPTARVLIVSSGEVYGAAARIPTPENAPLAPLSPYAASKAAAEMACQQARRAEGLDAVVARPFQHEGPGRDDRFAIGSWTRQIAQLERAGGGVLEVGNLDVERDICDVRDVCRAYARLLDRRTRADTYNIASGRAVSMGFVLERLLLLAGARIEVARAPERMRRNEVPVFCGDFTKLRRATGWTPEITLERTLADALDEARKRVEVE